MLWEQLLEVAEALGAVISRLQRLREQPSGGSRGRVASGALSELRDLAGTIENQVKST